MKTTLEPADAALERTVAAFLRSTAPHTAPPGLLDGALGRLDTGPAAHSAPRPGGLSRSLEWLGAGLMAALVVAVLGATALGGWTTGDPGAERGAGSAPAYLGIQFQASGLTIDANDQRFTLDPAAAVVTSDPGDTTYQTLEWTWQQHGAEMRLNLSFASDGATWWVSEVRTYDGRRPPDWAVAQGRLFERPLGEAFDGRVYVPLADHLQSVDRALLQVDRLVLLPTFEASDG
jgi:hypothetical protein